MIDKQTGEEVIECDGIDRRYRLCLCSVCDLVQRCIPENDFYIINDSSKKLRCSNCYRKWLVARGTIPLPEI